MGRMSNDIADSEDAVPSLNLKRISQSPVWNTHTGNSPLKWPPHATADPRQRHGPAAIPAFPGCTLIGPGGRRSPRLGTRLQPWVSPVRHVVVYRWTQPDVVVVVRSINAYRRRTSRSCLPSSDTEPVTLNTLQILRCLQYFKLNIVYF